MLFFDLSDNWIEKTDKTAHFYIDRANIQFTLQDLDIQLGRLAVGFGKPSFWNLFDLTPGCLFKALIQIPESSAKQGRPNFLKAKFDFIIAFSLNVLSFSLGP